MPTERATPTRSKRIGQVDTDSESDDATDHPVTPRPKKTKKLNVNEKRLQKVYGASSVRLAKAMHDAVRDVPDKYNNRSRKHFLSLLPKVEFDEDWTEEDERQLEERVMASDEGKDIMGVKYSLISVYKICYFFTGRLVTDIVGFKIGLVWGSDHHNAKNKKWSEPFIQRMQYLICHPFFRGSLLWMRLALQWSAICRTDDRRRHLLNGSKGDVFLRMLAEVMQHAQRKDRRMRPGALRRVALRFYQQEYMEYGDEDPDWSVLMEGIEARVCAKTPTGRKVGAEDPSNLSPPDTYIVTIQDVNAVLAALDGMRGFTFQKFHHSESVWGVSQLNKSHHDWPRKAEVEAAVKAVLLEEERQVARRDHRARIGDRRSMPT